MIREFAARALPLEVRKVYDFPESRVEPGLRPDCSPGRQRLNFRFLSMANLSEGHIPNPVLLPVLVVKMPPLGFVHGEAFRLHRGAQ
jgi:hypothetical protein